MKRNFEIVSHEPMVRLKIWGADMKELFSAALGGVAFYLKPDVLRAKNIELKEWKKMKAGGVDLDSLLVEFLSRVVAESDRCGVIFTRATFDKFGENFLEGKMFGKKVDAPDAEIRAISLEGLDIKKNSETGMYETMLMFEV